MTKNLLLKLTLAAVLAAGAAPCRAAGPQAAGKNRAQFALTFDDGPGYITEDLLKLLESRKAKATFFMLGTAVRAKPATAKKAQDAGHLIANHTDSHKNWFKLGKGPDRERTLAAEIRKGEEAIVKATGVKPAILRMPNGYDRPWVRETAKKLGYRTANWSYGSDWTRTAEDAMTREYLKATRAGAVLLLHDGGGKNRERTLRITAAILDEAARLGLEPVRLDVLLAGPAPGN
ncbi:MAG: polysaccharide deacetylase family protein [Elusimicrobiales bacterium]|nr:polysaccharide deacetylase family protein [Elusimicrobiales bacterium]